MFFIGFVGRPIGALIFGHWGDRIGRKATLIVTLLVTGIATVLVGCVPGYDSIGIWGAVLLTRHPPDPGHRRRRRMGRLGAARDGVGAHQQESRLPLGVAAIRRALRIVPGELRGAVLQLVFRRPVPDLGLAHPVLPQRRHGRRRAMDPARHHGNAGVSEDPRRGTHRTRAGARGAETAAEADHTDRAAAPAGAGAGLYRRCVDLHLRARRLWDSRATSYCPA